MWLWFFILYTMLSVVLTNWSPYLCSNIFSKRNIATVDRRSFTYTLCTSPPSLLFKPCRGLTNEVAAHFFSSRYRSYLSQPIMWLHNCVCNYCCDIVLPRYHIRIDTRLHLSQPITWLHNCVTTFAIIAVILSCCDITLYFSSGRGESLGMRLTLPRDSQGV